LWYFHIVTRFVSFNNIIRRFKKFLDCYKVFLGFKRNCFFNLFEPFCLESGTLVTSPGARGDFQTLLYEKVKIRIFFWIFPSKIIANWRKSSIMGSIPPGYAPAPIHSFIQKKEVKQIFFHYVTYKTTPFEIYCYAEYFKIVF